MKFSDLFEDLLSEAKNYSDEKFDRFKDNAGEWLFELFFDSPTDVATMPGVKSFQQYVLANSRYTEEELRKNSGLVYALPDYYSYWLNELPFGQSNKIMSKTIAMYGLQDKMAGRDAAIPKKRGRKPKMRNVEPEVEPQVEPEVADDADAMAHIDQAVEKRRRGRPSLPDDQKKRYIPTGLPRGRRPKVRDAEPEPEQEPEIAPEPIDEPVVKQRGGARPGAGRPNASKYEPKMVPSKIKTLEDRIASLEALLREKGILSEQRALLEGRLRMMKDYRKFL